MAAAERHLLLLAVNPPTRDGIIWANAFPAPKTETKLGLSLAHRRNSCWRVAWWKDEARQWGKNTSVCVWVNVLERERYRREPALKLSPHRHIFWIYPPTHTPGKWVVVVDEERHSLKSPWRALRSSNVPYSHIVSSLVFFFCSSLTTTTLHA